MSKRAVLLAAVLIAVPLDRGRSPRVSRTGQRVAARAGAGPGECGLHRRGDRARARSADPSAGTVRPAAGAVPPDDGEWRMPAKDYAATRFSSLDEITPADGRQAA